jgi:hypothetical protein
MFAIAAGYEDANDCDSLRYDPIFKMAVGHAPESGDRSRPSRGERGRIAPCRRRAEEAHLMVWKRA